MPEVFELSKRRSADLCKPTADALSEVLGHLSIALAQVLEMQAHGPLEQREPAESAGSLIKEALEILSPYEGPKAA